MIQEKNNFVLFIGFPELLKAYRKSIFKMRQLLLDLLKVVLYKLSRSKSRYAIQLVTDVL